MTTVRIIKNWDYPNLMAQSPGGLGVWHGIRFSDRSGEGLIEDGSGDDFVIVLNQPATATAVTAQRSKIWAIIQEPPSRYHRFLHRGQQAFARIYTNDPTLPGTSPRYHASQPALAWHVGRSFDELDAMTELPPKSRDVSWITSTLSFLAGHKVRLRMIEALRPSGLVDFYGRGLKPIERKWEGLAPYRYAIAFENHIGPHYWSEKLADCFLAGCMPIYIGCSNLEDYFPAGSFIRIDPNDPDPVASVRRIVQSDLAERNRHLIVEARRRVLHEHQLFPFIAREIASFHAMPEPAVEIDIEVRGIDNPFVYGMAVWHWKVKPLLPEFVRRHLP